MRIIDHTGENAGVMSKTEALALAKENDLDLVLISPNAEVPVARIIEWSKFKYTQSKKQKASSTGSSKTKEWWFKPHIEINDIETKLSQVEKFLKKGGRAKLTIKYKRRASMEQMEEAMKKVVELSEEFAELVGEVKKEGRNIVAYVKMKS